jgi:hypothetical protein
MINRYHRWKDRRKSSAVKPLVYLLVELGIMVLISWVAFILVPLWVSVPIIVALLYLFMTNCLKRYRTVRDRQKFYKAESDATNESGE